MYLRPLPLFYFGKGIRRFLKPIPTVDFTVDDTGEYDRVSSFVTDVIVLSLKSIPKDRIEGTLRDATVIEPSKCYYEENNATDFRRNSTKSITLNKKTRIHFISGIKSDLHLKQELDKLIEKYLII